MKLQHILIPIDFSHGSQAALDYASTLGEQFRAKLSLLHVIEPVFVTEPDGLPLFPPLDANREASAKAQLQAMANALSNSGEITTAVVFDTAWHGIVDWAEEHAVDLIVMPTHGRSGLSHFWLGSAAERVVQKAHCPVLVVRSPEPAN